MAGSPSDAARAGRRYERVFMVRVWEQAGDSAREGARGSVHELESVSGPSSRDWATCTTS